MNTIDRAYRYLLLSPVVLPVVIWNGLIYPYLVPKTLLFYALSLLTVGAFLVLVVAKRPFFFSRLSRAEVWIPAALLVLAYVASYAGIDFYRSFWSLFVRGDGLLMLTGAVASFYLILVSADRAYVECLLRAVAVVASFVAVYGIGEWISGGGRIGSLLGNAAFFAGYLGIALFVTLAAARTVSGSLRTALYLGAALQFAAIVLTATRGTILALGVALLCAVAYQVWAGSGKMRAWAAVSLAVLALGGGLFFAYRGELAHSTFTPIARIASISTSEADIESRLFIWRNLLGEIAERPWLGVGAEHIDVLFNAFYDPMEISESWFDRSHNAFLDYTVQYGIGGLALYLALIALMFVGAYRLLRLGDRRAAGLFALLAVTYAVQNFFVFDTISSFWLFLALLAVLLAESGAPASREPLVLPQWSRVVAGAAALILVVLIVPVSVRPALAAYDLAQAYRYQLADVAKEAAYLSSGMALGTYGDVEYGYEAYDMYGNTQAAMLSGEERTEAYLAALAVLTTDFNRYPYDARTALYLAHVLSFAPPSMPADEALLSAALERTIRLSPKRAQPWYILANLSISNANTHPPGSAARTAGYAAAKDILTHYLALVPGLSEPHFVLAQLEFASGDTVAAAIEAEKGRVVYRKNVNTARRAAAYYENAREWKQAVFFLKEILDAVPGDAAVRYDLAKATYLMGDRAGALAVVNELRASNPNILATDPNFLTAITAYEHSIGQ